MNANIVVDDEFLAGETDAIVGNKGKIKGLTGLADVHHNLGTGAFEIFDGGFFDFEWSDTFINMPFFTFGTTDSDFLLFFDNVRCIAGANHTRNPQFARDDGGMTDAAAGIGDDGFGDFHDRHPIGVGHFGD